MAYLNVGVDEDGKAGGTSSFAESHVAAAVLAGRRREVGAGGKGL